MDVKEMEKNWPPAQKESPQPKYKTLSFFGDLEDDEEQFCGYCFTGNYYEHDQTIRIVEASLQSSEDKDS